MRFPSSIVAAILVFASVVAKADPVRPVGGSGGGVSGTGTLYTSSNGDGSYTITAITGSGVDGLIVPGGFADNDNRLYPASSPALDGQGFGFTDTLGDTDFAVNLAYSSILSSYEAYVRDSDGIVTEVPATFSLATSGPDNSTFGFTYGTDLTGTTAPTPEPSGVFLMGTGLLTIGFRRRSQ